MQRRFATSFFSLILSLACSSESDDAADDGANADSSTAATPGESAGSETNQGADSSGGSQTGPGTEDCVEDDFAAVAPFAGPGWDPETGVIGEPQDNYYAHSTWIQVADDDESRALFLEHFNATVAQLNEAEGLIGTQLGNSAKCGTGRTLGIWRSQEAMRDYVFSGAHLSAITELAEFAVATKTTSWSVSANEVPVDFDQAIERLESAR